MILRIFKVVWLFSMLATVAVFMYGYASFPETVIVREGLEAVTVSREGVFYILLVLLAVFNMLVFLFNHLYRGQENFVSWFCGLIICLNLFLLISISFLSVYNGGERFDYSSIGTVIYGSIGLLGVWAIGWPVYMGVSKILARKSV